MKRDQIKELGVTEEQLDQIMKLHGQAIEGLKKQIGKAETKDAQIADLQSQLAEATKTIEGFNDMDIDSIKKSAADYKAQAEQKDKEMSLARVEFSAREHAGELRFSSKAAKNQYLKDILSAGLKLAKDGTLMGADDFAKKYAETDPDAFRKQEETPPPPAGQVDMGAKHENKASAGMDSVMNAALLKSLKK